MTSRIDIIASNGNDGLHYELNPPTSSMTNRQQRQVALDIGRCSDGRPCGEVHEFCQDAYCDDCPNNPNHTEQHLDMVNHPAHYQSENGIECIEAIQAQLTPEEFRGYCKGNCAKYVWRERQKGGDESIRKAVWYLNKMLEVEDAQINN